MRMTTLAVLFYTLLVGSVIAAPVELSPRTVAKPAIGSVVHVKPIDLKPNPAPQGAVRAVYVTIFNCASQRITAIGKEIEAPCHRYRPWC